MAKYIISGLLGLALISAVLFTLFSRVQKSGLEFCPETFETRNFSYRVYRFGRPLPSKIDREPPFALVGPPITKHLPPPPTNPADKSWHLVHGIAGQERQYEPATILVKYLEANNLTTTWRIERWSSEHNELAAVLWPAIERLAKNYLYFAVPQTIDFALDEPTATELQRFCDEQFADAAIHRMETLAAAIRSVDQSLYAKELATQIQTWLTQSQPPIDPKVGSRLSRLARELQDQVTQ